MTIPTVHLNGTSKASLLGQLEDASNALEAAYKALKQAAPNGRDYYLDGPDAITAATAEHMDRLRRLDSVKDEIDELARKIDEQG